VKRLLILITLLAVGILALHLPAQEPSGTISANPNPCVIEHHQKMCTTYLTWSTQNVRHARVFVVSEGSKGREESQFSGSHFCESCRAPWIERRPYTFTLYDFSRGDRGRALSSVTVSGR
jgi:hypothetical protein